MRPALSEEGKYEIDAIEIHAVSQNVVPKTLKALLDTHQPPLSSEGEKSYYCFSGNDLEDLRRDMASVQSKSKFRS